MVSKNFALIIEDDFDSSEVFATALEAAGYTTEIITDGQEAYQRIPSLTPSLIVLDLHLPRISGVELLQFIRSNQKFNNTPIILVTADQVLASQLEGEVNFMLIKPISYRILSELSKQLAQRNV